MPPSPLRESGPKGDDGHGAVGCDWPIDQHDLARLTPQELGEGKCGGGEPLHGGLRCVPESGQKAPGVREAGKVRPPTQEIAIRRKANEMRLQRLKAPRDKKNTLRARIEEYLKFVAMTCAWSTWSSYKGAVLKFERFVTEENIREIGAQAVMRYFLKLNAQGISKGTAMKDKKVLNLFFSWLVRMGYMEHNPASVIPDRSLQEPPKRVKAITEREYEALRIASIGLEVHYVIVCAWHTGMRFSDVCCLKWADVDLVNGVISVTPVKTKRRSRKMAIIPIHPQLGEMLAARHAVKLPTETYVSEYAADRYVNRQDDIRNQFKAVAKKAGVEARGFHPFRHAAIRRWLESSHADAVTVASMSGHSSLASLQIYSDPSIEKKRKIMGLLD